MAISIIDAGLSFSGTLTNRSKTERIILHHAAASSCTAEQIHEWHKANGWSGAGYHYLVRKDGSVYSLRPSGKVGAHAKGANYNSLGVCFEGDYTTETMGEVQKQSGAELVALLESTWGISTVQKHKDVCSTDCPGGNFPFEEICSGEVSSASSTSSASSASSASLEVDGLWGKETTKAVQKALGTTVDGIVSNQLSAYKSANPGLLSSSWEWQGAKSGGSPMVKALQRKIDVDVDGYCGTDTVTALQNYLGTAADGKISKPSACVKELQTQLNAGTF